MGEWVHIFPEGFCVQTGKLGTGVHKVSRSPERQADIGTLKWGVGKLIAHSADINSLVVVPIFHLGMHQLLPQHNTADDNSVIRPAWVHSGNEVFVSAGKPIDFTDLLADYEAHHGRLRKLELSPDGKRMTNWGPSSADERELYARITRRVEKVLLEMECEMNKYVSKCKWAKNAFVTSNAGKLPE
jgi:monolysocardiolipin acyltransferase